MFDWQAELAVPALVSTSTQTRIPTTATVKPPSTVVAPPNNYSPPKSFVQALVATTVTDSSETLPTPVIRGETLCIQISEATYAWGVDVCKRNLRGRLILNKGDKPYGWREVLTKLQQLWTNIGPWKMTPMGKGYFEFYFASYDDLRIVWAKGTFNLKPGLLRLFEWSKDFSACTQRQTHAQVWIRLLKLPQEYWMDRTLREIASAIGTPLLIDSATQNRVFGYYARILVDMDLSKQIYNEVMIEREGYSFPIEITYERLPSFCTHCKNIGHHITSCRWLHPHPHPAKDTPMIDKQKKSIVSQKQQVKKWQPMDNPLGIGSSKAFEAPVVHNIVVDSSTPQEDVIPLHVQTDTTIADNVQSDEVPIPVIQSELHQVNQVESEPADMPFTLHAPLEIQQENLLITSVHVVEEVTETQEEPVEVANVATTQSPFQDVMELEWSTHNQVIPTAETNDVTAEKAVNDMEISASAMPLDNQNDALQHPTDVHPTLINSNDGQIMHVNSNDDAVEQILEAQIIQPLQVTTVQQQEAHTSKNIQSGLDLWARICEYDQRTAEEGFTQVLSKQQKQARKKQVLGKPPYNTRTRGGPSPSIQ